MAEDPSPMGVPLIGTGRGDDIYGDPPPDPPPGYPPLGRYEWLKVPFGYTAAAATVHWANKLGFQGGRRFKEQALRLFVRNANDPDCRYVLEHYRVPVGEYVGEELRYYRYEDLQDFYDRLGPPQLPEYYGVYLNLLLNAGIEEGIEGAQEASDRLLSEPGMYGDLMDRPGFAEAPVRDD